METQQIQFCFEIIYVTEYRILEFLSIFVLIFACCELALYARARLSVNLYGIFFSGFVL